MGLIAVMTVAASAAFKIHGNDIWWHIRTGQWIWEHGQLPIADVFSHTTLGPWQHADWLAQLTFFGLHRLGGADALVLFKVLMVAGLATEMLLLDTEKKGAAALAICLAFTAMHLRLVVKPVLFSFIGFSLVLQLLRTVEQRDDGRLLNFIPIIVAIWGNFHRGATLALAMLAAALVAFGINRRHRGLLARLSLVGLGSLAAVCLNPLGVHILTSAFRLSASETLRQGVAEWAPLACSMSWLAVPVFVAVCAIWVVGFLGIRRRLDVTSLIALGTAVMAFKAVRFVPYAALAMIPGLIKDLDWLIQRLVAWTRQSVRPVVWHWLCLAIGLGLVGHVYLATYPPSVRGLGRVDWLMPVQVARFIKEHPPPGKMWNSLDSGGYLLYALSPRTKVFVDGRADQVYARDFFERCIRAKADPRIMRDQLRRYDIGFAVVDYLGGEISPDSILAQADWVPVYWDDRYVVVVRRSGTSSEYLSRYGFRLLRPEHVEQQFSGAQTDPMRNLLVEDVLANLKRAPDSIRANILAALLFLQVGNEVGYQKARENAKRIATEHDQPLPDF